MATDLEEWLQRTEEQDRRGRKKSDDLYFMVERGSTAKEGKLGRAFDVKKRNQGLNHGSRRFIDVLYVWKGLGFLEHPVHCKLSHLRLKDCPSKEWFGISLEDAKTIVAAVYRDWQGKPPLPDDASPSFVEAAEELPKAEQPPFMGWRAAESEQAAAEAEEPASKPAATTVPESPAAAPEDGDERQLKRRRVEVELFQLEANARRMSAEADLLSARASLIMVEVDQRRRAMPPLPAATPLPPRPVN